MRIIIIGTICVLILTTILIDTYTIIENIEWSDNILMLNFWALVISAILAAILISPLCK